MVRSAIENCCFILLNGFLRGLTTRSVQDSRSGTCPAGNSGRVLGFAWPFRWHGDEICGRSPARRIEMWGTWDPAPRMKSSYNFWCNFAAFCGMATIWVSNWKHRSVTCASLQRRRSRPVGAVLSD